MVYAMLQTEASCHKYQVWGSPAKDTGRPKPYHYMTDVHKAQLLKEPLAVSELGEAELR